MPLACVGSSRSVPATLGLPPPTAGVCASPVCTAQAPGCSVRSGPCVVCGIPQKQGLGWACVLCLPCPSSSGSQELDGRTLPGCGAPSPLRGPSLSFCPRQQGACALCRSVLGSWSQAVTLPADVSHPESQKSLVRNWTPLCSLVGGPVSGAEFAPFLFPSASRLRPGPPPASSSLGSLSSSFVLRTARSVFGPLNFLSLSCYPTV